MNERRQVLLAIKMEQMEYWKQVGAAAIGRDDVRTVNYAAKQLRRITYTVMSAHRSGKFKLSPFVKATKQVVKKSLSTEAVLVQDVVSSTQENEHAAV